MYGGTCVVCKRDLVDGVCLFCTSKRGIGTMIDAMRPRIALPDTIRVPWTVPMPKVDGGRSSAQSRGKNAPPNPPAPVSGVVASCEFIRELVTSLSAELTIGVLSFDSREPEATISVEVLSDGTQVLFKRYKVSKGRSSLNLVVSRSIFRAEYMETPSITVKVVSNGEPILVESSTIRVRPIYDIPLDDFENQIPHWITPNNALIKEMLLQGGPVMTHLRKLGKKSITGYQAPDASTMLDRVMLQAEAVFNALCEMGFGYVMDVRSDGEGMDNYQRVRTPEVTIRTRSGVCIDTSCLMASIFEAMGLHPVLIFPPGHAMVGVIVSSKLIREVKNTDFRSRGFVHVIRIRDTGDGSPDTIQAVFIESTMICGPATFAQAVHQAGMTLENGMDSIVDNGRYTVVYYKRRHQRIEPFTCSIDVDAGGIIPW